MVIFGHKMTKNDQNKAQFGQRVQIELNFNQIGAQFGPADQIGPKLAPNLG